MVFQLAHVRETQRRVVRALRNLEGLVGQLGILDEQPPAFPFELVRDGEVEPGIACNS